MEDADTKKIWIRVSQCLVLCCFSLLKLASNQILSSQLDVTSIILASPHYGPTQESPTSWDFWLDANPKTLACTEDNLEDLGIPTRLPLSCPSTSSCSSNMCSSCCLTSSTSASPPSSAPLPAAVDNVFRRNKGRFGAPAPGASDTARPPVAPDFKLPPTKHSHRKGHQWFAVTDDRGNGVFSSWDSCAKSVMGYPHARLKGFHTFTEAQAFVLAAGLPCFLDPDAFVGPSDLQQAPNLQSNQWPHLYLPTTNPTDQHCGPQAGQQPVLHPHGLDQGPEVTQLTWCSLRK